MLLIAISIFSAFRFSEAYSRWWEARKLWDQLVSASRTFGRQVRTLLTAGRIHAISNLSEAQKLHEELICRQNAYVNALRLTLRQGTKLDSDENRWDELTGYLSKEELEAARGKANVPMSLLQNESNQLANTLGNDYSEQRLLLQFDETIHLLQDAQTGCERIKSTAFPDMVSYVSRLFVWVVAFLIPISVVGADHRISITDVAEVIVGTVMVMVFVFIERLARDLEEPFAGTAHDTPMSALSRNIEIDLLELLDKTEIPPKLAPDKGILL